MAFIFVYITNPNEKHAKKVALHLLKKKLIACANISPIDSLYWWKGNLEESKEYVLIVKTRKENWNKLKTEVKRIHSYSVPCITKINVNANKEYEDWLRSVVR
jgi:periplasmic divalent cation tolerance protein